MSLDQSESKEGIVSGDKTSSTETMETPSLPPMETGKITITPRRLLLLPVKNSNSTKYLTITNYYDFPVAFKLRWSQNKALYSVPSCGWVLSKSQCVIEIGLHPLDRVFKYRSDRAIFDFARLTENVETLEPLNATLEPFCQVMLQLSYSKPINKEKKRQQLIVANEIATSDDQWLVDEANSLQADGNADNNEGPATSGNSCPLADQRIIDSDLSAEGRLGRKRHISVENEGECLAHQWPIVEKNYIF
ncbi:Motile Sperm domain containing protein [Trichuris trichiura]|uniref:Major sperm protein n=1 Tax=Trichuris trichiura TaxID=36087 RepID=A0A077Z796_TRITR|nr:Motile Sperm domain containing protein [Trichuris trichiura]